MPTDNSHSTLMFNVTLSEAPWGVKYMDHGPVLFCSWSEPLTVWRQWSALAVICRDRNILLNSSVCVLYEDDSDRNLLTSKEAMLDP